MRSAPVKFSTMIFTFVKLSKVFTSPLFSDIILIIKKLRRTP